MKSGIIFIFLFLCFKIYAIDGLIGKWKFYNKEILNEKNVKITNGVITEKGVFLNGKDGFIEISCGKITKDEISISISFRPESYQYSCLISQGVKKDGKRFAGRGIYLQKDGTIHIWSRNSNGDWRDLELGKYLPGEFYHIVFIQKGNLIKGYLNYSYKSNVVDMQSNMGEFYEDYYTIGRYAYEDYFFNGIVEGVEIYERELKEDEIKMVYYSKILKTDIEKVPEFSIKCPVFQKKGEISFMISTDISVDEIKNAEIKLDFEDTKNFENFSFTVSPKGSKYIKISSPKFIPGTYRVKFYLSGIKLYEGIVRVSNNILKIERGGKLKSGDFLIFDLSQFVSGKGKIFNYRICDDKGKGIEIKKGDKVLFTLPKGRWIVYAGINCPWKSFNIICDNSARYQKETQYDWEIEGNVQEIFCGGGNFKDNFHLIFEPLEENLKIYYLRLISPTDEEFSLFEYKNDPKNNKRIIYNNDGYTDFFGQKDVWSAEQLYSLVDRFKDTDCEIFEFSCLVSGAVNFPSKYATYFGEGHLEDSKWWREADRQAALFFRKMDEIGLPVFKTIVKRAKEDGLKIFGSLRMSGYYGMELATDKGYVPHNGDLWHQHPEYRIKDKNGNRWVQMSFAYRPVQEQRIGVLTEMVEMGVDGVTMDFCRYPYILGYDDPLIEEFMKKYNIDPRNLPENDERWVNFKCEFMNNFFREARRRIDEVGKKLGKDIKIAIRLPATGYKEYGFDPETWVKEGLVDILIPHYPGLERDFDVRPWVKMVKGSKVKLYPGIEVTKFETAPTELGDEEIKKGVKPGQVFNMTSEDYRRKVYKRYKLGADGAYLFNNWYGTGSLNLLGDKKYLEKWSYFEDILNLPNNFIEMTDYISKEYEKLGKEELEIVEKKINEIKENTLKFLKKFVKLNIKENSKISGKVPIICEVESVIPEEVRFYIDEKLVSVEKSPPYQCFGDGAVWDTTKEKNGIHNIKVVVITNIGLIEYSINVIVEN